jgi:polysaccharide biosynthesis protein PelF
MTAHAPVPRAAVTTVAAPSAVAGPPAAVPRSLRVALVSEGCYPFHPGGVSLWCHQLVQGMPENPFTVVALTVDGTERSIWSAPRNLTQVVNIPLWVPRRRRRGVPPSSFTGHYEALLHSMLQPLTRGCQAACADEFVGALRGLYECAQTGDLTSAVIRNDSLDRLGRAWHEAGLDSGRPGAVGPLTLRDAVVATDRIEHLLRPLSHPPVRADLCHLAMNGVSALVGFASKWAYGTPMVLSEHGVYLRERYLALATEDASQAVKVIGMRFMRRLATAVYRSADILTPHSSYNRRWQLYSGADPARMRTMYNGVNPDDFPIAQGEPEDPTIVFVGRIDPLKDLHTLIRAFAIVRERIPNARLRMFGPVTPPNRQYFASCVQLITDLGLSGAAAFEGPVTHQVDAYQAGHLVALTSVSEGFPFTVVESMATGRPQVCTNVGGISEAVGKDAGFVVPPRDHGAVADACIRLLEDADLRHAYGVLARKRVLELFTLDQWTNAYREIYAELVPAVPPDASVSPAGDRPPPAQRVSGPDEDILPPAPYSRIARELAEVAHSHDPGTDAPRQEDGGETCALPVVHAETAIEETCPPPEVHRDETAGMAIDGLPLNGPGRKADVPGGPAKEAPGPVDGPAEEALVAP